MQVSLVGNFNKMEHRAVLVIMYHSIGKVNKKWIWRHLTCPWELFQNHLKWLKRMEFHSTSLQQLYEYKKSETALPLNSVILTFDDGYLDNWVFAYPLLKKYGFKGVIFVNPDFVNPQNIIRKNLEDVWNNNEDLENLETAGFVSWKEIEIMKNEGVMDIQSHSMTHTWYFCSDKIIDFHHPNSNKYPWLFWNAFPERKSHYLDENQECLVSYGTPIYEHGRSLGIKRYFDDISFSQSIVNFVKSQRNDFFKDRDWRDVLFRQINIYKTNNKLYGRYETDEEQKRRFEHELIESKRILEGKLRKKVNFLCWPGGAKTDLSMKVSREAGYLAFTCSAYKEGGRNIFSEDPAKIYRIGPANIQFKGRICYLGGLALIIQIFSFRGSILAKVIQKAIKLFNVFAIMLELRRKGISIL